MQQGGQYGEVPPYARPNSASSTANANTATHAHLFNLSHEVAAAATLPSNPPSISHTAASASGHQHHAGAAQPYSLGQVLHQHHHSLRQQQQQQQHFFQFQDHLSHPHDQQSPTAKQQQIVDHSGTASSSSSPVGLHLHQTLQKQGMVPSISMVLQQHGAGGPEAQQQMQQTSILQQQYTQQKQQHTLGLAPKPSIPTLQQAARVQQQHQEAGSSSQAAAAIAVTVAAASGRPATDVLTQSAAPASYLIGSTAAAAVSTMVTPNLVTAVAPAMAGLQQLAIGSNNNNKELQADQGVGTAGVSVIYHQQAKDMQDIALGVDELDKGGSGGNRWPRQETLALLKVRSEMDSSFRDSSLKRPLWDEVSRKLAELGYQRSAKKCKEKFENVHKYYKRSKEGKAGRQDGKNYRFFSELEALYGNAGNTQSRGPLAAGLLLGSSLAGAPGGTADLSTRISNPVTASFVRPLAADASGLNFSSETSSSDDDNDDEYDDPSDAAPDQSKKRKRKTLSRMMASFESLLKQVMEKQEQMQQRFLDALERREQDRMVREEAWKRQEMARMSRENDLRAQERSLAATRDAAIVAFLQKVTGQTVQLPTTTHANIAAPPVLLQVHPPLHVPMPVPSALDPTFHHIPEDQDPFDPNSKRWPKPEVLVLIKFRTDLHSRFTEPGPKGPLWEDIANGMSRLGYNRNAKRCKEKWENINKYFKKAKESNKNRPENAKTCPYYHQLDALYKQGVLGGGLNIGNSIKALPYKSTSDNLGNVDNAMLVHQGSGRGGRVEGNLVALGSTSPDQVLSIMPPASQMSTASDATASTDNTITPVNTTVNSAKTHLFSGSNPDNSGGDMTSKDINVHTAGGISPDVRPVDVNMTEINVAVDNTSRVDQQSEDVSMQRTGSEMQCAITDPQHSRSTSNQGYMEHKVDLEQDARQLIVEEDEVQQKQQVILQAQIQQYQQEMIVSSAVLSQPGLATQSFIANMLQKFNNDPAESNTSTTSTNQELR